MRPSGARRPTAAIKWEAAAAELAREFAAPVAIFDPRLRRFCAVAGGTESHFPEIDDALLCACRTDDLAGGHVLLWRRPNEAARSWLFLPSRAGWWHSSASGAGESTPATAEWDATRKATTSIL